MAISDDSPSPLLSLQSAEAVEIFWEEVLGDAGKVENFTWDGVAEETKAEFGKLVAPKATLALIEFEFERALALLQGIPPTELDPATRMSRLFPRKNRREAWTQMEDEMELKLPKLGTPVWLQQVLGAMLLGGMVLPFWYLWWGLGLFWGTVLLLFGLEKRLVEFPFSTLGATIARTAALNPILEEEFRVNPASVRSLIDEIRAAERST